MTGSTKRLIAAAACGVAVLVALVAKVVDYNREPTTMERWPQFEPGRPITIGISPALKEHERDILKAISEVNRQVGCPVLSPSGTEGRITLKWVDTEACGQLGRMLDTTKSTEGAFPCKDGSVEVHFADLAHPAPRYPTILHGIGHAIGLAHDYSGRSVMLDPVPQMVPGGPAPELTTKDRDSLAQRHCR